MHFNANFTEITLLQWAPICKMQMLSRFDRAYRLANLKSIDMTLQTTQVGRDAPITCRIPLIGSQLCTEALLDIEYIKAVGGAIPLTDIFNKQFSCEALSPR